MDPKLKAEQEQRAELERLAKEDPDSWAAQVVQGRNTAIEDMKLHKKGSPYLTRALRGLQLAEQLERQVWKQRYQDKAGQKASPPKDAPTEHNPFTEALRNEHTADNGRPTTTGTDPNKNEPTTQEATTNGVLAAAHDGEPASLRVTATA